MVNDKLSKVRAEIERLYHQSLVDKNRQAELGLKSAACTSYGKSKVCKELLSFIDSMQEECNITGIKSKHATGKLKELVDNVSEEGLEEARKQLEELTKECMYSKDNYTDEDRKVLCDGCEEECRFNKKEESINNGLDLGCGVIWKDEEPVSEDLEEAAKRYATEGDEISGLYIIEPEADAFKAGAQWQKQKDKKWLAKNHKQIFDNGYEEGFEIGRDDMEEQMMANAIDVEVKVDAGGYPCIPQMELYDYEKDIPLAKKGDKYKVILIKE